MPTLSLVHLFESVLEVVDDALDSAAEAQKKTSNWQDVDEKVERAIQALKAYEKKYHPKEIVAKRWEKQRRRISHPQRHWTG